jgi:hypothetical protein
VLELSVTSKPGTHFHGETPKKNIKQYLNNLAFQTGLSDLCKIKLNNKRGKTMKNVKLDDIARLYLLEVREKAALKAELENKEFLEEFLNFLYKNKFVLEHMNDFGENQIVEYYLRVKEKANDNQEQIINHVNVMYDFLKFLEEESYYKLDWFRVKESKASYGSDCD